MTGVMIQVRGTPAPQGSKTRNRYGAVYESSKAVGPWRNAVRTETQRAVPVPLTGPLAVRLAFVMPRPRGHYGIGGNADRLRPSAPAYPARMPDLDKLCRAVLDGLTDGGAWKDDGQVVTLHATKRYALPGAATGVLIEIEET